MSEPEYKELVLAEYDRQMDAGELPSELLVPKPATIKAEVVKFCEQVSVLSTGDETILRSFAGAKADVAAYHKAFQIGKADPFRQVVKVLTDRKVRTNIKYVNLLALLIGFPTRPFHPQMKRVDLPQTAVITNLPVEVETPPVQIVPSEQPVKPEQPEAFEQPEQPARVVDPPPLKSKRYQLLWLFVPVILVGLGWYAESKRLFQHYSGYEGCMVWVDDHYEPIECNDQSSTAVHYPIKHDLVDHFQRITCPETLSYQSVRKVWYSNYKGRMEFYTESGPNPLDTNLRVLPMTAHIFEKYVLHITN